MSTSQRPPSLQPSYFFAGVDLGQKHDFSVVAVVRKTGQEVYLVHIKRFRLGTEYGSVIGYLTNLNEKLKDLRRILIDRTGVGEVFVEEAVKSGLKNAQGIHLSLPSKQEVMTYLRQQMENNLVHIPYDRDFMNELNVEQYELMKTGQIQYSHPSGTHDDRLWAFALAVYASRAEVPKFIPAAATGRTWKPHVGYPKGSWEEKFRKPPELR